MVVVVVVVLVAIVSCCVFLSTLGSSLPTAPSGLSTFRAEGVVSVEGVLTAGGLIVGVLIAEGLTEWPLEEASVLLVAPLLTAVAVTPPVTPETPLATLATGAGPESGAGDDDDGVATEGLATEEGTARRVLSHFIKAEYNSRQPTSKI